MLNLECKAIIVRSISHRIFVMLTPNKETQLIMNQPLTKTVPTATRILLVLVALSLLLIGISTYLTGSHRSINFTAEFYRLNQLVSESTLVIFATIGFLSAAALTLLAIVKRSFIILCGSLLVMISLLPLGTLLSQAVWIEQLGGFPAIGSGQGIIKYFALFSIAIYLINSAIKPAKLSTNQLIWLNFFPVALVYLWIGGMKFTLIEAQGIEDLVASSPLMGWLYNYFDLQMTSNLIGMYDLMITLLLALSLATKRYINQALLLASSVFIVTQTFLFSWPDALSTDTLLSGGGQFIIKDIWFIANLLIIHQLTNPVTEPTL